MMKEITKYINSFKERDKFNDDIWLNDETLRANVRKQLLKIAYDFHEFLSIPWVRIKDIVITGSIANYNWSRYSDIDLHIIIDYKDIHARKSFVADFLHSKIDLWTLTRKIKIKGFDVEVFAQNVTEDPFSKGIYSLKKNKWIRKPEKKKHDFDKDRVKRITNKLMYKIDHVVISKNRTEGILDRIEKLKQTIRTTRRKGLKKSGEFSEENLAFKVLRRSGYLDKLHKFKIKVYDDIMSI